jgi:hypothetical protein
LFSCVAGSLPPVFHHTFSQQTLQAVLPTFFIIFLPVRPKKRLAAGENPKTVDPKRIFHLKKSETVDSISR